MELNHKELSLILAGLMTLQDDPEWFLHIMLVDIQEQMKADDLRRLIDRMVDKDMETVDQWSPGTSEIADKIVDRYLSK